MKKIFITGASNGIGKAAAKLFQREGWNVVATMRNPQKETELSKLENVTLLPLDVTNSEQIKSTVEKALTLGAIDVVLNNAGISLFGPMEAMSEEQIMRQINTNLLGTIRVTQDFIPHFREKKSGLFINITSIAGLMAHPFSNMYHATKWGIEGWSESLSIELAMFNLGVKIVEPSGTSTNFFDQSPANIASHPAYDPTVKKMLANIQLNTTPEQIADVIYEAATDGKDQLRYLAGENAIKAYNRRLEIGPEAYRKEVKDWFLGLQSAK